MTGTCHPKDICEEAFAYYAPLNRLQSFCVSHYSEPITLAQAAAVAGLEPSYFSTYFHQKVGVNFTHWLGDLRVREAQLLFRDHYMSVSAAATATGFGCLSTFERTFKRATGKTASAYRAEVRPD